MSNPKNPIVINLILLFLAQSVNDFWSIVIGMPTPIQLALIFGIFCNLRYFDRFNFRQFRWLVYFIVIYIFVLCSYMLVGFLFDLQWQSGISILMNMIWVITSLPHVAKGINQNQWLSIKKYFLLIVVIITIPTGLYELIKQTNILPTNIGISDNTFHLRGLHIDKLEFASYLCLAYFMCLTDLLFLNNTFYLIQRFFTFLILIISFILIFFSFSTTAILGMILGTILIFFKTKKISISWWFVCSIFLLLYFVIQTDIFVNLSNSYLLKYEVNVENLETSNFRYLALESSWVGFTERPIFGYGIGQSSEVIRKLLGMSKAINPHNIFANELLDFGIFGFIFLFLIIVKIFSLSFKRIQFRYDYLNQISLTVKAFSILIAFRLFFYYHRFDQTMYFFWIVFSLLLVSTYRKKINLEAV